MKSGWSVALLVSLSACSFFGSPTVGVLPPDPHASPKPEQIAAHPCRYGNVAECVARCQVDNPSACNEAGAMFEFADGDVSSAGVASRFYDRSCSSNYGPGCNNLAWLYLRGRGVPKDHPHAMLLFMAAFDASRLACARGEASECLLAGELLYEGRGVGENQAEALAFFQRACDGGEARGCELTSLDLKVR